ncbi:MAG: acetate--CoA ligase family protein [Anaerolineales bacterium]|nr:acetate--CoA ligase family protein [Anaerolineales bacterium]
MRPGSETLLPYFKPRGIAVIGASADPEKIGHGVLKNLLHPEFGFRGPIYPVNPKASEILGLPCYPSVLDVPDPLDLAVIVVPSAAAPAVMEDCGRRGVKATIILSGGFRETGPEGAERERQCVEIAARYGMRLMGPNCIGVMDMHTPVNTTFVAGITRPGKIDFVSQSGALCGGILDWAQARGINFSRFLSIGNKAEVNEADLMRYLAEDEESRVLAVYVEDVKDGADFLEAARYAAARKPVLILKGGRSQSGQAATASHTGALAGAHAAFAAAAKQSGLIEFHSVESMFNAALALAHQPLLCGDRVAVLTNAGGPAVLAADALESVGLKLAAVSPETRAALRPVLAPDAALNGPVDMLGGADERQYRLALEALLEDSANDGILVILVPTVLNRPAAIVENLVAVLRERRPDKPVLLCLFGEAHVRQAYTVADLGGLPAYRFPEDAAEAFGVMHRRARRLKQDRLAPQPLAGIAPERAQQLLAEARRNGQRALDAAAGRALLEAYGIPMPQDRLATNAEEAARFAVEIGFPVALKLASPDILHKTEVGGVLLNLTDEQAVRQGWQSIVSRARAARPAAEIRGVQVQPMVVGGQEVILGVKRDPIFGPLVMFGLGGIYVEALADVSFRLAPLSIQDAEEMIDEVRSAKLLAGLRGAPPADRRALLEAILRLSQLAVDCPEIEELDVNPLIVLPAGQGALAVDVRVVLRES